jgi:NAD(P)-dependent dehydrogenase (short-subunit alcohol dehydrogenase family)
LARADLERSASIASIFGMATADVASLDQSIRLMAWWTMSDESTRSISGTRLADKVALVVGGGSTGDYPGTGSAIARLFAAQGAKVVVMGRTEAHTEKTVAKIEATGGTAVAVLGDTTVTADCEAAVGAARENFGRLDVVVNNVAVHKSVQLDSFDEAIWDEIYDGNVKAAARMTSKALPLLRESDEASVVNIGSVAGLQASGAVGYGTAKGAVPALTRDLAMALGKDGIRVNCVIPGHLHTPHVENVGPPNAREIRNRLNMLGIEGDGWDAAFAALFFASDESRFITGQCLCVDGGVTNILAFTQVTRTAGPPAGGQS